MQLHQHISTVRRVSPALISGTFANYMVSVAATLLFSCHPRQLHCPSHRQMPAVASAALSSGAMASFPLSTELPLPAAITNLKDKDLDMFVI
ncbi:hypothetical protein RRG08_026844 [Elysia crispata]|uniref:Uncharacterized protein n=1 Tax=Elysia crispata TaxID=231223 RepID=A0AAE1CT32_9GAST|nr:hypothetical protein RRG08_026844 [Elysia crispata]